MKKKCNICLENKVNNLKSKKCSRCYEGFICDDCYQNNKNNPILKDCIVCNKENWGDIIIKQNIEENMGNIIIEFYKPYYSIRNSHIEAYKPYDSLNNNIQTTESTESHESIESIESIESTESME